MSKKYNSNGIRVDKQIEKGLTAFFKTESSANEYASYKRSYTYICYEKDEEGNYIHAGWCVPN